MFTLTTDRLLLRQIHIMDSESLYQVFGDAEVMRFGDGVQTREWIQSWLLTCFDWYYKSWGFGPYAVVTQHDREVIGYCGLFYFPDLDGQPEVEIGYRLARSAWGQGYATEAAHAVRDYTFSTLGIKRLIAMIDPSNTASIHVAKKIGMQYEKDIMLEGLHSSRPYLFNDFCTTKKKYLSSSPCPSSQIVKSFKIEPPINSRNSELSSSR